MKENERKKKMKKVNILKKIKAYIKYMTTQ